MTAPHAFRQVWQFLTRLNVAAVLIVILLLLMALGSCFPQWSASAVTEAEQFAQWEAGVRARYGPLTGALATVGLFRWFHSPVFLVSLALLAVATFVCTIDRWGIVWQRAFRSPSVTSDHVFHAAPHSAEVTGLQVAELPQVLRNHLEERGFRVRSEAKGDILYLRGDRNQRASLATLVTHAAVLLLLLGVILSSGFGWREELIIEPDGIARPRHESQLALRNEGFDIVRYPDGSVAAYQARVAVNQDGREVMRGRVGINQPLAYNRIGLYLRGYSQKEGDYSIHLLVTHDPGYGLVIAAGFLLLLGLTVTFYFPRCWIQARIGPGEAVRLAGWAERRACDFGYDFMEVVAKLNRPQETGQEGAD